MQILIVEDDDRVAGLVKRALEEQGYATDTAKDGSSAYMLACAKAYDLIITDILLPESSGLEFCKKLRKVRPDTPVIMLTALGATDDKLEGFDAGADDYLVKPFEMRELLARVRVLHKRRNSGKGTGEVLRYADLEMNMYTKITTRNGAEIRLTPKEFQLLSFLLQHPGRILSRTEIAAKVWDTHFDTGTNFIDVYINYLRKKIDRGAGKKLIHTRPGMGFILKEE